LRYSIRTLQVNPPAIGRLRHFERHERRSHRLQIQRRQHEIRRGFQAVLDRKFRVRDRVRRPFHEDPAQVLGARLMARSAEAMILQHVLEDLPQGLLDPALEPANQCIDTTEGTHRYQIRITCSRDSLPTVAEPTSRAAPAVWRTWSST
jgi:hypothetical protein